MEQILLAYSLPKETIAVIKMIYKNMKVKVLSPDGNTDYFDIVAGVFIICLDYTLRTSIDLMKENCFKLAKEKKQKSRY